MLFYPVQAIYDESLLIPSLSSSYSLPFLPVPTHPHPIPTLIAKRTDKFYRRTNAPIHIPGDILHALQPLLPTTIAHLDHREAHHPRIEPQLPPHFLLDSGRGVKPHDEVVAGCVV